METSAKSGHNVDQVFQELAIRIYDQIENKLLDYSNENYGIKLGTYYKKEEEESTLSGSIGKIRKKKTQDCC